LERLVEAALANPAAAVFHGSYQTVDEASRVISRFPAESLAADPFHLLLDHCPFVIHSVLIRRSAFARAGLFDVSIRCGEDWDLWIRLAATGHQFLAVPEALAVYRRYPGSVSTSPVLWRLDAPLVLQKSRVYHGRCRLCQKAIGRATDKIRRWSFELLLKEMWMDKLNGGARVALGKAVRATYRDPMLAPWFARELIQCLREKYSRDHGKMATSVGTTPQCEKRKQ
jgi:GT2 family glycosyltransferase